MPADRQHTPLSTAEKIQLVKDRFDPLREGAPEKGMKALVEKYKRNEHTLAKAIRSAFTDGLVTLQFHEEPIGKLSFSSSLERSLRDRFNQLDTVRVVADEPGDPAPGDRVHRRLGMAVAELFEPSQVLRDGDVIGVGSGRGVYYSVEALHTRPRARKRSITIMSLTGAVFPTTHSDRLSLLLDADLHIALMAACFAEQVSLRPIAYPIAPVPEEEIRKQTWLSEGDFPKHVPFCALIGVGVLEKGHRLYEAVRGKKGPDSEILKPIHKDLAELVTITEGFRTVKLPYCPVGDVCNYLFFVPPPQKVHIDKAKADRIRALIASINEKTLTIRWNQLSMIQKIVLVAGTAGKALAIQHLLRAPDLNIRVLCTNEAAAKDILERS
jgi:DNA-binding transcriptional regulator LsrR (DeoR family)